MTDGALAQRGRDALAEREQLAEPPVTASRRGRRASSTIRRAVTAGS